MSTTPRTRARRVHHLVAALLASALLLLTACSNPSPESEARDDGQALGEAIAGLGDIDLDGDDPQAAVDAQIDEIDEAASTLADDVGEQVRAQLDQLEEVVVEALNSAFAAVQAGDLDEAAGALSNGFSELDATLNEMADDEDGVVQAALEGIRDGLDAGPE